MEQPSIGGRSAHKGKLLACAWTVAASVVLGVAYSALFSKHQAAGAVASASLVTTEGWHPRLLRATKNHHFTMDGVKYYMLDVGVGPHTALLVHGMPDDGSVWDHQVDALVDKGYRVLVPDMLGYGNSDRPLTLTPYRADSIVKVMVAQLQQLNVSSIDIVGHDWGASVSWGLVLTVPSLFRRHVAISVGHPNTFPSQMSPTNVKANWYMYLNTQTDSEKLYAANDCKFFKTFIVPTHPRRDEVCQKLKAVPHGFTGMVNWDRANQVASMYLAVEGGQALYPKCSVPTLGIWSDGDAYLWEDQVTKSEFYMTAEWRYVLIKNASHWPMVDKPGEVTSAILKWIEP